MYTDFNRFLLLEQKSIAHRPKIQLRCTSHLHYVISKSYTHYSQNRRCVFALSMLMAHQRPETKK